MVPKTVGGYEIIRPLGAGGMGQVLLARDPKLERMVALKVLHRDFAVDPTARKRFQREAKSIASLSHPGIVTIYEIGEDQGRDFIVMEFLGGENLRSLVAGGALEQSEILAIVKQIAEAVAGAHGAGVLHRDIKPENIMVDADAGIKVVDFGLARSFDEVDGGRLPSPSSVIDVMACTLELELDSNPNIAQAERQPSEDMQLSAITETILGTPGYMAPELFIGKSPTTASDIYSLGVVLYEMIAGELPFVASSVDALLQLRVHDDAEAPRLDKRPGVAADVADLVVVMLKKKPEERPTIRSVIDQIQAAQDAATQKLRVLQSTSPPLAGLSQEIDVFTPRRRRRALKAATMVSLGAALTAGLLVYRSAASSTTPPVVTNQPLMSTSALETNSIRIAVTPISLELRSYAHANSHVSQGAATMLSTVLNRADAIYAIAPLELQVSARRLLRHAPYS
jgi:serine/threonine-protein kinase